MWRAPRLAACALVAFAALGRGSTPLAAIEVTGSVVARVEATKTSVGINLDREQLESLPSAGRNFDQLALLVPKVRGGEVAAAMLPADWDFDPVSLRASGPAISSGVFRFDFPKGWKPPTKLGLQGYSSGRPTFKLQIPVKLEPPIRVDTDLDRWLDLPQTIQLGTPILLSPDRNKQGTPVDWTISSLEPERVEVLRGGAGGAYGADAVAGVVNFVLRDSSADQPPRSVEDAARGAGSVEAVLNKSFADNWGLLTSYRWSRPRLAVEGQNRFGETLVRGEWTPTVTPPCHHPPARPSFTGLTEVVAPHESFCVCGQVGELGQWNGLGLGGSSLGAPIVATSTSAIFLPPAGLAPGSYPLTYQPWGGGGGTGLSSAYIDVRARIHKDEIRYGGSTLLTLDVLGTDRVFPVTLDNRSPQIIDLEGGLHQTLSTSGGPQNSIARQIYGLVPGKYTIDYEVVLPTCPCDASNLQVAERAGDEFLGLVSGFNQQLANRWMLRPSVSATTEKPAASELRFGAGYRDGEVTSLSLWPSPPGCVHLGGPVACPQGLPSGSYSERFVPGGTTWTTPSGGSVFVPARNFPYLVPEFAGVAPSNDFQSTTVEQPKLPASELFGSGARPGGGAGEPGRYGEADAGELDGQAMHPVQATEYESALGGSPLADPGAEPTYKSEFLGGIEFEVARSVSLGVRYVHRNLPRVLDELDCLDSWQLNLGVDNRYRVQLEWPVAADQKLGACRSGQQPDSGLFFKFAPENHEVLVKVLNGCAINGRYWVFASGLTNVEYRLNVTDGKSGQTKTYSPPARVPYQPIVDTQAFATCP